MDVEWKLNVATSFTVEAVGDGLMYRWFIDKQEGNGWEKSGYSGNSTKTHPLTMWDGRQKWKLYCEITDVYGHIVRSNVVSMVVAE